MSSQKGNGNRTRGQRHQNTRVFKNNLHDTSKRTRVINELTVTNVCKKCKAVIEWKIKYKKYKMLKNPSTCNRCHKKCVKDSYHNICQECSSNLKVCPKCGEDKVNEDNVENVDVEGLENDDDSDLSDDTL